VRSTDDVAWQQQGCSALIDLPPLAVVWLASTAPPPAA
jgi:hypothetical protein